MFRIAYYFIRVFSEGLDASTYADTLDAAIAKGRAHLKEYERGHAVITEGARLCATLVFSKGRLLTKRK